MKNKFQKLIVGFFAFALCMCLTSTIAKAGTLSINARRVADDKTFIISITVGPGETYSEPTFSNWAAHAQLVNLQGNVRQYRVSFTESCEMIGNMTITIPGVNGTPDMTGTIQVYMHDATDEELEASYGDSDRGGGQTPQAPQNPSNGEDGEDGDGEDGDGDGDGDGEEGDDGSGGGSGTYGNPEDLANVLSVNGGIGEVVFDFLKLVAVILTFGCLCFLGFNLMTNKNAEERASTMIGFKYIIIGILLLDVVLLLYALFDGLMGNQESEVEQFSGGTAAIETNWEEI